MKEEEERNCTINTCESLTGRSWAASTSEGLLIYSLDTTWLFDPLDLDVANTPSAVKQKLKENEYATGIYVSLTLVL